MNFDLTYNGYKIIYEREFQFKYQVFGPYTWQNDRNDHISLEAAMKWIDHAIEQRNIFEQKWDDAASIKYAKILECLKI